MKQHGEARRSRLLIRAAVWVVHHASIVSLTCCVFGLLALMLLPALSKNVYVDENALLPGSGRETFHYSDASNARNAALELHSLVSTSPDKYNSLQKWFASNFEAAGADYNFQRFCPPAGSFSSFEFFTPSRNYDQCEPEQRPGLNAVGIIRAPQGEGNEAIVVVTPYDLEDFTSEKAMLLGLGSSLFRHLSRSPWLARDIVWLASDSKYGDYTGVAAWLKEYHEPDLHRVTENGTETESEIKGPTFKRAGKITAGFVLKLGRSTDGNTLQVEAEGSNGQMPNMDMISIVNTLVAWRQGFRLKVDQVSTIRDLGFLKGLGGMVESVGKEIAGLRRTLLSQSKAGYVTSDAYVTGVATLVSSCWKQMLGVPTGSHGAFRDYQVDAITLKAGASRGGNDVQLLVNLGRLMEGVIRSVNNLLEQLHASLFLYLMVSPTTFVSISVYIIPFALLLVNFPVQAAALFSKSTASLTEWVQGIVTILAILAWSLGTAVLPTVITTLQLPMATKFFLWTGSSILGILAITMFLPVAAPNKFIPLKALMLALIGTALGVLSTVDFSVALAGCLMLLPMCLSVQPLRLTWESFSKPGSRVSALIPLVLSALPASLLLMAIGTTSLNPVILWTWAESMWFWGSSLYTLVFLVQLPSYVLCAYLLQC